ncbi:MAG: HD domain-containing protein [Oscillospiraceae bacterium]|nr:HD domain-containing protein [Oscillospiraceae bacterium]
MDLPPATQTILHRLHSAGHEAYAVGGCVRDALRGGTPHDWDICTSASPAEIHRCFPDLRTVDTGAAHGTVTVILEGAPYEVTTFRRDGHYADHRRPDEVQFVRSLEEDLARRDFTINAMAVGSDGVIRDFHGGQTDLAQGIIRCVGNPVARFQEDALRILRALRFAAVLDFTLEPATAQAACEQKALLQFVSAERIYAELNRLLVGPGAARVLRDYTEIIGVVLPEILPCVGFQQHNPCHYEDVWSHTLTAFAQSQPDRLVRWALLLHDLGKPETFTMDENGIGHFKEHPIHSRQLAEDIFQRLHADRDTRTRVCRLVLYHDAWPPGTPAGILRWQREFGLDDLRRLAEVRRCDGPPTPTTPKWPRCGPLPPGLPRR